MTDTLLDVLREIVQVSPGTGEDGTKYWSMTSPGGELLIHAQELPDGTTVIADGMGNLIRSI